MGSTKHNAEVVLAVQSNNGKTCY